MTELTRRAVLATAGAASAAIAGPFTVATSARTGAPPAGEQDYKGSKMTGPVFMPARQRLAPDTTLELFVSPTGDDANNGWSPATAMRTPQRAVSACRLEYDLNGLSPRVRLAHGEYPPVSSAGYPVGYHGISVVGDEGQPDAVIIRDTTGQGCFVAQDYGCLSLVGVRLEGLPSSVGIYCRQHAIIDYRDVMFGAMEIHVQATACATVSAIGGYEHICGGCTAHWSVAAGSTLNIGGGTIVNVPKPVSFGCFALSQDNASLQIAGGVGFSGAGAVGASPGSQAVVQLNAILLTAGLLPYFPPNGPPLVQHGGIIL
jgi:hypothetical protein